MDIFLKILSYPNLYVQVENVYLEPPSQRNKARVAKRNFEVAEGDLLTLLNVFNAYKQQEPGSIRHWCSSRFLNHKALRRADQLYDQVSLNLKPLGDIFSSCYNAFRC